MKVLIVGSGGREHALAWRLSRSPSVSQVFASPGNPGIAQLGTCFPAPRTVDEYPALAEAYGIDLTVVGPEVPLTQGIVDRFRTRSLPIIGPTSAAARLEGSKIFAKQFFGRAEIPTARSVQASNFEEARKALKSFQYPIVIKADGLAAGKGVIIARDEMEALDAIVHLGPLLVLEEFLDGEEVSFIGLSNGTMLLPFAPTQDHKRAYDGDTGPNTGGMGAICDSRLLSSNLTGDIMERVMLPCLHQMQADGSPFTGFLYAGIMLTAEGPKVLEFNVRLGDPETQTLMYAMRGDLGEILLSSLDANNPIPSPDWTTPSVCIVMAAQGYPESPRAGDRIEGLAAAEASGATVFQAGTRLTEGSLVTSGGRVLGITAGGETLSDAMENSYRAAEHIRFQGAFYRKDIGHKGLRRW